MGRKLKTIPWQLFLNVGQQIFISEVTLGNQFSLLFSKVSGSTQMMGTFFGRHRLQRFELHWYDKDFLWISYETLLSKLWSFKFDVYFDNSVSFMYSQCVNNFAWLLYQIELPFRSSVVNKAVIDCCKCSFVY